MDAALRGAAVTAFVAVKVELPTRTLRLLDGSGELFLQPIGFPAPELFTGEDDVFGVLAGAESISEGLGTEAPRWRMVLHPRSNAAMAEAAAPQAQGSPVTVWFGVLGANGQPIVGEPEFVGEIDNSRLAPSENGKSLTVDVASAWERMFERNQGRGMSAPFWESVYPGDLSMQFVPLVTTPSIWGVDGPARILYGGTSSGVSNGGYQGGGGGGGQLQAG
jgi:hypothetical protein